MLLTCGGVHDLCVKRRSAHLAEVDFTDARNSGQPDCGEDVYLDGVFLSENVEFTAEHRPGFLGGVTVLTCKALTFDGAGQFVKADPGADTPLANEDGALYQPIQPRDFKIPTEGTVELTLIPYYAWANRGLAYLDVWMPLASGDQLAAQRRTWRDAAGWTVVNDNHPDVQFGPGMHSKTTPGLINNDEHYTQVKGSYFEYTFTGTDIIWLGSKGPWRGYAEVYLDGEEVAEVNPYSPREELGAELFRKEGMPRQKHTIRIVCSGRKGHTDGKEPHISLDAFKCRNGEP